jgi:hypothetical protein
LIGDTESTFGTGAHGDFIGGAELFAFNDGFSDDALPAAALFCFAIVAAAPGRKIFICCSGRFMLVNAGLAAGGASADDGVDPVPAGEAEGGGLC